jgi:hypothetical protein
MRHIPNLSTFHFYHYIFTEINLDTSGLRTFLSTHSTGLQALRLNLLSKYDSQTQILIGMHSGRRSVSPFLRW